MTYDVRVDTLVIPGEITLRWVNTGYLNSPGMIEEVQYIAYFIGYDENKHKRVNITRRFAGVNDKGEYSFNTKVQSNSVNSTSDNSKTCLTQTMFHGPCLGNDNLLVYLELLVITRTDKPRLVQSNLIFFVAGCVHILV